MKKPARRFLTAIVAVVLVIPLYFLCLQPAMSHSEAASLSSRFAFTRLPVPELAGYELKNVRSVHPTLKHISAWISSVGAAVALADLDGDGLPNDLCLADPRIGQVMVAPAAGSPPRYPPFALDPAPLVVDASVCGPSGCLAGDFNEDGLTDILVYYWGRTPILYLRKESTKGSKTLAKTDYSPVELLKAGGAWFTSAATLADFDGDGHQDLLIANYFPDGANILNPNAPEAQSVHNTMAKSFNGGHKHFFLGIRPSVSGEAPFKEVPSHLEDTVSRGWTLAAGATDLDGDLLPELYLANDFGPDRLLHNRSTPGKLSFVVAEGSRGLGNPKSFALGRDSFKGMGVDFADLNNDGVPDIYVSNIAEEFGLQESHFLWLSTGDVKAQLQQGVAPYRQASEELGLSRSGWGWDCRFNDFDNDGVLEAIQAVGFIKGKVNRWPELQTLGTANSAIMQYPSFWPRFQPGDDLSGDDVNPFFVRAADGRYYDIAKQLGMTEPMVCRGIAPADIDGDGRMDWAVGNQWGPSFVFMNQSPQPGTFLGLHLMLPVEQSPVKLPVVHVGHPDGSVRCRPAIGAVAKVQLPDGRVLTSAVDGGTGHSGKRSQDVHFGLGKQLDGKLIKVELRWRAADGTPREAIVTIAPGWNTVLLH